MVCSPAQFRSDASFSSLTGEPIVEPEVDLSTFLEKQRITDTGPSIAHVDFTDHEDVDTSLAHIGSKSRVAGQTKKGKVENIEWDDELENMSREKASAEAAWGEIVFLALFYS